MKSLPHGEEIRREDVCEGRLFLTRMERKGCSLEFK